MDLISGELAFLEVCLIKGYACSYFQLGCGRRESKGGRMLTCVDQSHTHTHTYHRVVPNCCLGVPRKSLFLRCSRIQTTAPTTRKEIKITPHNSTVNGLKIAQVPELSFFTGVTTTRPDSIYGWVKSTMLVRLVMMAMSPTAASYTYTVISVKTQKKALNTKD